MGPRSGAGGRGLEIACGCVRRFLRLLEILGDWYERGKVLVFVSSQEQCDNLFRDLLKVSPFWCARIIMSLCVITSPMT